MIMYADKKYGNVILVSLEASASAKNHMSGAALEALKTLPSPQLYAAIVLNTNYQITCKDPLNTCKSR